MGSRCRQRSRRRRCDLSLAPRCSSRRLPRLLMPGAGRGKDIRYKAHVVPPLVRCTTRKGQLSLASACVAARPAPPLPHPAPAPASPTPCRAPTYEEGNSYHPAHAARVVELAALQPGERVLDVGCGTGLVTLPAARAVGPSGKVTGVDLSDGMIHQARTLGAVSP